MRKFEIELEIHAVKYIVVDAIDEDNALDIVNEVLDTEIIPILPEEMPEVTVNQIYPMDDFDSFDED